MELKALRALIRLVDRHVPALLFLFPVTLYLLSDLPGSGGELLFEHADKVAHFILFTPVGYLFSRLDAGRPLVQSGNNTMLTLLFVLQYSLLAAGFDELHQYFVSGRSSDWYDLLADVAGAVSAFVVFSLAGRNHPKKNG